MRARIESNSELLRQARTLVARRRVEPIVILDELTELLYRHRKYYWIGIYLSAGRQTFRQAFRGPIAPCDRFPFGRGNVGTVAERGVLAVIPDVSKDSTYSMCFVETKSEIVVPIRTPGRVLGVIDVESDRLNGFSYADQALLKQVAAELARYLSGQGRRLMRRVRESAAAATPANAEQQPAKHEPESERGAAGAGRRAAAGAAPRA